MKRKNPMMPVELSSKECTRKFQKKRGDQEEQCTLISAVEPAIHIVGVLKL